MSNYIKEIVVKEDCEGEQVVAVFRPASVMDILTLSSMKGSTSSNEDMVRKAVELLPKYLVRLTGLHASNGEEVTAAEVFESAYFMPLISNWFAEWMKESQPKN